MLMRSTPRFRVVSKIGVPEIKNAVTAFFGKWQPLGWERLATSKAMRIRLMYNERFFKMEIRITTPLPADTDNSPFTIWTGVLKPMLLGTGDTKQMIGTAPRGDLLHHLQSFLDDEEEV